MKKVFSDICITLLVLFLLINMLTKSNNIASAINTGFIIWKENLFPFLFPIFVISELLVSLGISDILAFLFSNITTKLFKSSKETAYIFIMSLITGFPSSAKYINELYKNKKIDDKAATKILMFTHFSNPLFIYQTIATTFLGNPKLAILIYICHYLPNILIGIIFRNYNSSKTNKNKYKINDILQCLKEKKQEKIGVVLSRATINSINTLLLILGTISIFLVITSILNETVNLGSIGNTIVNGIIEMSQGLKYVSNLNISLRIKTIVSIMFISFGGLSVHLQVASILSETKIKYLPFLFSRIIHAMISGILAYLLFPFLTT